MLELPGSRCDLVLHLHKFIDQRSVLEQDAVVVPANFAQFLLSDGVLDKVPGVVLDLKFLLLVLVAAQREVAQARDFEGGVGVNSPALAVQIEFAAVRHVNEGHEHFLAGLLQILQQENKSGLHRLHKRAVVPLELSDILGADL